ncbi:MAG: hypothetical protein DLM57_13340 [Pseudonocardiales bacterium]|nr:MAG: hypothetical protein DLM57_13340 [Pseudonocardiales bacterium]
MDLLPLGDLAAELTLIGRYLLAELSGHREVTALIEKEGAQFAGAGAAFLAPDRGSRIRAGSAGARTAAESRAGSDWDCETLSVIVVDALVNYRRGQWTFNQTPLDVDEARLVATLVRLLSVAAKSATT